MLGIFKKVSQRLEPDERLTQMQEEMTKLDTSSQKKRPHHIGGKGSHPTRRNHHKTKKVNPRMDNSYADKDLGDLVKIEVARREQERVIELELRSYLSSVPTTPSGEERYTLRYHSNVMLERDGRVLGFPNKASARTVRDHLKNNFQIELFISSWIDHPARTGATNV